MNKLTPQEKISRARAHLNFKHRFYGAHALSMHFEESTEIPTMATNYFKLLWNPKYVDSITPNQVIGVVVHEILHRIFLHPFRIRGRSQKISNIAMDLAINHIVLRQGFELPPGVLDDKKMHPHTWEIIYRKIFDKAKKNGQGQPDDSPGSTPGGYQEQGWGQVLEPLGKGGKPMDREEARAAEDSALTENRAILDTAKKAGNLPGDFEELISQMYEPDLDYESIFWQIFAGTAPAGYSMRRHNKSLLHNYGMFGPGRNSHGAGKVWLGFDVSGSITNREAANVLGILNNIISQTRPEQLGVIQFDHKVQNVEVYEANEEVPEIKIHGRGGTSFCPQFDYIRDNCIEIDQYIVVTDGYGDFPSEPAPFPVTWLMTTDVVPPWGNCVRFKVK